MNITYYWLTMGPYHYARMNALQNADSSIKLNVIEATNKDDHNWKTFPKSQFDHKILLPGEILSNSVIKRASKMLYKAVLSSKCDVFVNGAGYFHPSVIIPLLKLKRADIPLVLWAESTQIDQKRYFWKEYLKSKALDIYDYAIVAGKKHKEYLEKLGMQNEQIKQVGNVVDNKNFATQNKNRSGFLYVGRFLSIKNLDVLVRAYKKYRNRCSEKSISPDPLILVGNGETEKSIKQLISDLDLSGITLTGILQIEELKKQYASCRIFVLPSISEPWGLVINEAMAAGMPVIVSSRCGAVPELISHGKNGFLFDPFEIDTLSEYMFRFSEDKNLAEKFGRQSRKIIANFTPETYAENCLEFFKLILSD